MSPYRVMLTDNAICAAMVSTDKQTGVKKIYIVQKVFLPMLGDPSNLSFTEKDVAYSMSTRNNSCIVDSYQVFRDVDNRRYSVFRIDHNMNGTSTEFIQDDLRTLFDCQMSCMAAFCEKFGHTIDHIL